jgi:hypothetical protein
MLKNKTRKLRSWNKSRRIKMASQRKVTMLIALSDVPKPVRMRRHASGAAVMAPKPMIALEPAVSEPEVFMKAASRTVMLQKIVELGRVK